MRKVAALYVATGGVYTRAWAQAKNIDPWDILRDARMYAGPHPVIAHPPCNKWSIAANGLYGGVADRKDGGEFAHALMCVRLFGGVLEHPATSYAWARYGVNRSGEEDAYGCRYLVVDQANWGHAARKRTGLYVKSLASITPPVLVNSTKYRSIQDMGSKDPRRKGTPIGFARDLHRLAVNAP